MKGRNLDRLLRSAAKAPEESTAEPPFGFETRVVALSRAGNGGANEVAELTPFLRWVGVAAVIVLTLSSTGVYQQYNENETLVAPQTNEYAIADSAIQTEFQP